MDKEAMGTSAAAVFMNCTDAAIYKMVVRRAIPYRKKGKKLNGIKLSPNPSYQ